MTCLEGSISRMVGPIGSVSETTLLHFGIRVERRWNHPSISFRWGCVLLESKGCSLPLGEVLEIRGRVYRAMLLRFEIRVEPSIYFFSFRLCTLGRWCFGEILEKSEKSKKVNYTNRFRRSRNVLWTCKYICEKIFENCWKYFGGLRIFLEFSKIFLSLIREVQKMRVTKKSELWTSIKIWVVWVRSTIFG